MDTISEKDTQSADDKKKEKISYIEAIPEWQALRRNIEVNYLRIVSDRSGGYSGKSTLPTKE